MRDIWVLSRRCLLTKKKGCEEYLEAPKQTIRDDLGRDLKQTSGDVLICILAVSQKYLSCKVEYMVLYARVFILFSLSQVSSLHF